MVLPRGLKKVVTDTAPGKLTKGKFCGYRAIDKDGAYEGPTLKGITKLLAAKLYSIGELDTACTTSTEWTPPAWQGESGGLRRGKAVDAQVSRLAGASEAARKNGSKFKFTSFTFSALAHAGLEPVAGQRVVVCKKHGIATACDIVCYHAETKSLVVVELKCGFSGNRTLAATLKGAPQRMAAPCKGADDSILNRHLAQLTVTRHLLASERSLKAALAHLDITDIRGALLYVRDADSQLYPLSNWWIRRGAALVKLLGQ